MHPPTAIALATLLLAAGQTSPAVAQDSRHTRTVCEDVTVRDQPKDKHQIAGTAVGAVAGGLLGHQVGGGKGKTLATVGGAVAGGVIGNKVQEAHQDSQTYTTTERRCDEVQD